MKQPQNASNYQAASTRLEDSVLHERIQKHAYQIWLAGGASHGEHLNHWLQAESEVLRAISQEQQETATARKTRPALKQGSAPHSNHAKLNT